MYRNGQSAIGEMEYRPATAATRPKKRIGALLACYGCRPAPMYIATLESTKSPTIINRFI